MKKNVCLYFILGFGMAFGISSCNGGQKVPEEPVVDYAAIVSEELPSMAEFLDVVDGFQQGTAAMLPTGQVWENSEQRINEVFGAKGFETQSVDAMGFFIFSRKNCEFTISDENYVYSYEMTPNDNDSVSAAYYFVPMGDFYVKGEIMLADTCIYDALVDQIQAEGFVLDEETEGTEEEKYLMPDPEEEKDCYYYLCNREEMTISLEWDFMAAQEIRYGTGFGQ